MISTCHKDKIHVPPRDDNITKPNFACDYNIHMESVHLSDRMLQLHLTEQSVQGSI